MSQDNLDKRNEKPPSVILTTTNYHVFALAFRNQVGDYGDAGKELLTGVPKNFDTSYPLAKARVSKPSRDSNNNLIIIERLWDSKLDTAALNVERKLWRQSKVEYAKHQGKLWTFMINSLSIEMLQQVQGSYDEFVLLQSSFNTLGLWKLIKRTILEHGDIKPEKIHTMWASQTQGSLQLFEYTALLNSYLIMLRGSSYYPSNSDQVLNFLRGCDKIRYKSIIGRATFEEVPPTSTLATWTSLFQKYDQEYSSAIEDASKNRRIGPTL
jgi:hypothetical protein